MADRSCRTIGVEEELLLIDGQGRATPLALPVVRNSDEIEHELKQEQAEISSDPQSDLAGVRAELVARRLDLDRLARAHGGRAVALATSPLRASPHPTPDGRYARMEREFGLLAGQQLTCGQHVHVSVESRAEGVAVLDRIRGWLPVLRALAANSPFSQGADTGYASYRTIMWGQWPTSGPTDVFDDESGYDATVASLINSGAALDEGMLYFDARLSVRYPTVEIRVADVCTDVDDAVLVAALCRALVVTAAAEWRSGLAAGRVGVGALRAASWRAARWGLEGELMAVSSRGAASGRQRQPAWAVLADLVDYVRDALRATGDDEAVAEGLAAVRRRGNGAQRQRRMWRESGELEAVVTDAADRTVAG